MTKKVEPATMEQIAQLRALVEPVEEAARLVLPRVWAWKSLERTAGAHPDDIDEHVAIYHRYYVNAHMTVDVMTSVGVRFEVNSYRKMQCTVPWWVLMNPDTWEASKRTNWEKREKQDEAREKERKAAALEHARKELERLYIRFPELKDADDSTIEDDPAEAQRQGL